MNKYHIKSLLDESVIINIKGNKIRISGLDDAQGDEYWQRQSSEAQRLASLKKEDEIFHILLSHRPNLAKEYANNNFDLVFCGHAHGGQVRIPNIINGLVAPNQGLLPRYTKGVYKLNDKTTMVVSAGLIRNKVPRINNQPELVVATIDSKGE